MSKRYFLTLPDGISDTLERWAELEDNKPTTLAAFLLERAIRDAVTSGEAPEVPKKEKSPDHDPSSEIHALFDFLTTIANGEKPTESILLQTAKVTGISPEQLSRLALENSDRKSKAQKSKQKGIQRGHPS